ncbi:hypothetical protein CYMTET_32097 [Cymbomonas tetramitiformis]|uniref:Uncharacterized protein n=1 Tax=Cymbomonas tetramitiformis TaxID=36881 RepID=A0AAE0FFQ2_9CHLO|nr:hypothetical protein CYMTET_32097 [Cymbomonas tetramitiformis]
MINFDGWEMLHVDVHVLGKVDCANEYAEDPLWDHTFPKYSYGIAPTKKKGIELYWDEYHDEARRLQSIYPENFRIFPSPDIFHNASIQLEMLKFAGYEEPSAILFTRGRLNCMKSCRSARNGLP